MQKPLLMCMLLLLFNHPVWSTETTTTDADDVGVWTHIEVDGYQLAGKMMAHPKARMAVLIVAGSGPTDHNGNVTSIGMNNNSYRLLAQALHQAGYSVLRYDKRGLAASASSEFDMSKTLFPQYVNDVVKWTEMLQKNHAEVAIIGHSLGGLMAIQASQQIKVDKLITLAGIASSGYVTIKRQMQDQPEFIRQAALPLLDRIHQGEVIPDADIPPYLNSLFAPTIQPYLKSFLGIDPRQELNKISTPTLVVIGDHDLQVTVLESTQMIKDMPHVQFNIINGMNHVLKPAPSDRAANLAAYYQPDLPLHTDLVPIIVSFLAH